MAIKQITSIPSISPEGKSIAKIREIRGKSLVWNQVFEISGGGSIHTTNGVTISKDKNDFILSGTATADISIFNYFAHNFEISGHKYIVKHNAAVYGIRFSNNNYSGISLNNITSVQVGKDHSSAQRVKVLIDEGTTFGDETRIRISVFDLTLMFGSDNEPSTVEEFEAMFPENYYEHNSGEIINSNITSVETVGFNQWDEEWEAGTFDSKNGEKLNDQTYAAGKIRNKNYIKVFPNTTYYVVGNGFMYWEYDKNKTYIKQTNNTGLTPNNGLFTTTESTYYINFRVAETVYNHNICINLSDLSRNGTYEPYKKSTLPLNISTLTGKLNGEGESVKIFPDGLRGVGEVYDSLIVDPDGFARRAIVARKVVDLGTLNWKKYTKSNGEYGYFFSDYFSSGKDRVGAFYGICDKGYSYSNSYATGADKSIIIRYGNTGTKGTAICIRDLSYQDSTPEEFKAAMSGVELDYELATPLEYVLDTPIPMFYNLGSTESVVSDELSTPLIVDIDYYGNSIKHIQFNDETHCVRDERITGIDIKPIEKSTNVITSGAVYNIISEIKKPLSSVSYKTTWLSSSSYSYHLLMNIKPIDWEKVYTVKYRLNCSIEDVTSSNTESVVTFQFTKNTLRSYYIDNAVTSTSYKSF